MFSEPSQNLLWWITLFLRREFRCWDFSVLLIFFISILNCGIVWNRLRGWFAFISKLLACFVEGDILTVKDESLMQCLMTTSRIIVVMFLQLFFQAWNVGLRRNHGVLYHRSLWAWLILLWKWYNRLCAWWFQSLSWVRPFSCALFHDQFLQFIQLLMIYSFIRYVVLAISPLTLRLK